MLAVYLHTHQCAEANTEKRDTRMFLTMASSSKQALKIYTKTVYISGNDAARNGKIPSSVTTAKPSCASIAAVDINPTPIFDFNRGEYAHALA